MSSIIVVHQRDSCLFAIDLLRFDIGSFERAVRCRRKRACKKSEKSGAGMADAYRFNTLGVAYMNPAAPADAQKIFRTSAESRGEFAPVARLNLGVSCSRSKVGAGARARCEGGRAAAPERSFRLVQTLAGYKDLGER